MYDAHKLYAQRMKNLFEDTSTTILCTRFTRRVKFSNIFCQIKVKLSFLLEKCESTLKNAPKDSCENGTV